MVVVDVELLAKFPVFWENGSCSSVAAWTVVKAKMIANRLSKPFLINSLVF